METMECFASSASVSSDYSLTLATLLSVLLIFYRGDLQKLERLNKKKWRVREISSVIHFPCVHEAPSPQSPEPTKVGVRREVLLFGRNPGSFLCAVEWQWALGSLLNIFSEGCFCLSSGGGIRVSFWSLKSHRFPFIWGMRYLELVCPHMAK